MTRIIRTRIEQPITVLLLILCSVPVFADDPQDEGSQAETEPQGTTVQEPPTAEGRSETIERQGAVRPTGRVDTVERAQIEAQGATTLVEALRYQPGVRLDNQCSICNTTQIRLGGLPGDYTLITVDGIPLYGSLGTAYGLLQLDTAGMARVEILRGVNSVLYGSQAVAGVVDIVTRDPLSGLAEATFELGSFEHRRATAVVGTGNDDSSMLLSGFYNHHAPVDRDDDAVAEFTGFDRAGFTLTARTRLGESHDLNARGAFFTERRQGGTSGASLLASFDDPERRLLNETIVTERIELGARDIVTIGPGARLTTVVAGAYHEQDSDYEGELYRAHQTMGFAQSTLELRMSPAYELATGATYRLELLRENVALTEFNYHQPGVFALGRWRPDPRFEVSHGLRLDYHNEFGEVIIPEAGVRWTPTPTVEAFVLAGAGFRAPTTFFEQFKGIRPQGYSLVNAADSPERSWSVSGGADVEALPWLELSAFGHYTRIEDPLTIETFSVDENGAPTDGISRVEVQSSNGYLGVSSAELGANMIPAWWLNAEVAWTAYFYDDPNGVLITAPPAQQGTLSIIATPPNSGTTISLAGELFGPMDLAGVYGEESYEVAGDDFLNWVSADPQPGVSYDLDDPKLDESPWYGVLNLRIAQRISEGLELYVGADNLLDFHQSDVDGPLYFFLDEGEPIFDVIHIWGPMRGRFVYGGMTARL